VCERVTRWLLCCIFVGLGFGLGNQCSSNNVFVLEKIIMMHFISNRNWNIAFPFYLFIHLVGLDTVGLELLSNETENGVDMWAWSSFLNVSVIFVTSECSVARLNQTFVINEIIKEATLRVRLARVRIFSELHGHRPTVVCRTVTLSTGILMAAKSTNTGLSDELLNAMVSDIVSELQSSMVGYHLRRSAEVEVMRCTGKGSNSKEVVTRLLAASPWFKQLCNAIYHRVRNYQAPPHRLSAPDHAKEPISYIRRAQVHSAQKSAAANSIWQRSRHGVQWGTNLGSLWG